MNERYYAIYLRTSVSKQELGIESQHRAIMNYLEQNQIKNFVVFTDQGHSGSKSSRPALDEMLTEVKAGKVHTVMVFALSRLGRSVRNLLELVELFKKHNTEFCSITERIDSSPVGKLLLAILGALAEMELTNTRSRVVSGLNNARAKGVQLGRRKTINDGLVIELHSKGYKHSQIASLVKCHPSTISKILKVKKSRPED